MWFACAIFAFQLQNILVFYLNMEGTEWAILFFSGPYLYGWQMNSFMTTKSYFE